MGYTALYRKYRPDSFDDVIGQEHITTTLTNQIKAGKVSHAYLFTGSRGTGKTSCAKIFAKAVNCESPKNGSPCGKCKVCKALADENNIDILEIDAASNNKVDEIREIRERVQYPPVHGKYKVYIIDEVHMLTDSAFNALLKTLEEPPSYVIFILATTEVHKLPATILSRCMRFDFRLVAMQTLAKHLEKILTKEKREFEKEALDYIALLGEGSVRDTLSVADMCVNYSKAKLTYKDVLNVLGASNKEQIASLLKNMMQANTKDAVVVVDSLISSGKSVSLIAKDLVRYARDMLMLKTSSNSLVVDTKENLEKMLKDLEDYSSEFLISVITDFSAIDSELRYSISPRIVLETAIIKSSKQTSLDLFSLSERVRRLEEILSDDSKKKR